MTNPKAITKMPSWPRRMQEDMAAAFCGVSLTKFRTGVRKGIYPLGVKDGGNVLWYLEDLNHALDTLKKPIGGYFPIDSGEAWMESLNDD